FGAMTDAADLARRFLVLWEDYLTAVLSDPSEVEVLQCWVKAVSALARGPGLRDGAASAQVGQPGPPADAASIARAPSERDDAVVELARRLAALEERIAALEHHGRAPPRPRRRNRRVRTR